jgi:hypothetical protein
VTPVCGLVALLRPGGPVRVPLRECCAAALVGADGVGTTCAALPEPVPENVPATTEASW